MGRRFWLWLVPVAAGATLQTTIERSMAGQTGVVLVAEAGSGRLLAHHRLEAAAKRLVSPGSTVKPFVLMALLESGKAGRLACEPRVRLAGRRLDCTHPALAAPLEPASALAYSCNSYFTRMAARLDPAALAAALRRAGLASRTGLAEAEAVGTVRNAAGLEELQLQALGEAAVEVTPLGLLAAYRQLALRRAKNDAWLAPVFEGLEGATAYGSGQLARPPGLTVAGKTGTSASRDRGWTHAWFAGYAPAAAPEIVVVVFLEQGRGGADAAPVAGAIFQEWAKSRTARRDRREVTVRLHWLTPSPEARVIRLPLEEYVAAVLAGESSGFASEEALKAMAVAARTYAVRHLGRHRAEGFDFCDTTHCQDLRLAALTDRLRAAAEATEGELLWHQGSPALTYYHRHCAGTTEAAHRLWPGSRTPYLIQQSDTFCTGSGRDEWRSRAGSEELRQALRLAGIKTAAGPLTVEVIRRTPSGRAEQLSVGGARVSAAAFHLAVGRALGWDVVRSNLYEVTESAGGLAFRGYGSGHGVGLCQTGAARRGEQGHSYRQILAFYFPGTALGVGAQGFAWTRMGGARVEVWSTRPQQDQSLVALADRLAGEAERRAGFAIGFRPRLRVYPSVAAYRDATGEPGWVAASTSGQTVRLQPLRLLRSRGRLEATLLHEMLHLAVDNRAHPKVPLWFREGMVLHLANPAERPASPVRASAEPTSEAEMRQSYRSAQARVRALVDRHGRDAVMGWLERGLPGFAASEAPDQRRQ